MGFLDKIKQIKEENKKLGQTMKRMNDRLHFYGNVNYGIKDGDFWGGSYINIEGGKGLIYSSAKDDYVFGPADVKSSCFIGDGVKIPVGSEQIPSLRFRLEFTDGKQAQVDVMYNKVDAFKSALGL